MNTKNKKTVTTDLNIEKLLTLYGVGSSLMEKEVLISRLKHIVFKKRLLEGGLQTEQDLGNYLSGFLDCYKMLK